MEQKKGLLKSLTIQFAIVLTMAVLLHYVWMESTTVFDLPELKFPKSFAIALFLRLWIYMPILLTNCQSELWKR